ncbi:MAG: hypothetical protein ACYTE1_03520, partial [Planctomycetota bacterium]
FREPYHKSCRDGSKEFKQQQSADYTGRLFLYDRGILQHGKNEFRINSECVGIEYLEQRLHSGYGKRRRCRKQVELGQW